MLVLNVKLLLGMDIRKIKKSKELYEAQHPETKQTVGKELAEKRWSNDAKTESVPAFVTETAKKLGKSETFVKEHLKLNDLKDEIKFKNSRF